MWGNDKGKFGPYELYQLLSVKTLLLMLVVTTCAWFLQYAIPVMEGAGGYYATIALILTPIVHGLILKYQDNTDRRA